MRPSVSSHVAYEVRRGGNNPSEALGHRQIRLKPSCCNQAFSPVCAVCSPEPLSMHYEGAPCFTRLRLDEAPPPLRYAVQGFAALRRRWGMMEVPAAKEPEERIGKSAGKWHFTLRERYPLTRMTFPPRRQLQ